MLYDQYIICKTKSTAVLMKKQSCRIYDRLLPNPLCVLPLSYSYQAKKGWDGYFIGVLAVAH